MVESSSNVRICALNVGVRVGTMGHLEKKLESKTVFEGYIFSVDRDRVLLENGAETERDVVRHGGAVCVVPLTEEGEVYLIHQFRYAVGEELWELPAGRLEQGEVPLETARRELEEECGLSAASYINLHPFYPSVGYCGEVIYMWAAKNMRSVPKHLDDEEFLTTVKLPLEDAVSMVLRGEIRDGKTIARLLKAKLLRDTGQL